MADQQPFERLDALLSGESGADVDAELLDLARVANDLRHLPREEFRTTLRHELERTLTMTTETSHTGTPMRRAGISYMHIPAQDARRSAAFYRAVFEWELRGDPDQPSFDDGTGDVIGAWDVNLPAAREGGVLPYVFVDSVDSTLERVVAHGGEVLREPYPEGEGPAPLWVATFRDPAGNAIGVWQPSPRVPQPSE